MKLIQKLATIVSLIGITCLLSACIVHQLEITKTTPNFIIKAQFPKNKISQGITPIAITLTTLQKKTIPNAKIEVKYTMPPMSGMPPMNYMEKAYWDTNQYKTNLDFSMPGSWNIIIRITNNEISDKINFNIDVQE